MRAFAMIVTFTAFAIILTGCGEPMKHMPGKDTVESFGNGDWSIIKAGGGPNNPRKTHLHRYETQDTLVNGIVDCREDGDWVYAVGADGLLVVLNYRTHFQAKYKTVNEAPDEYQAEFRKLRK